ncbi:aspartyl/asparaginyl beta-hydroxylase domain-containing protein [Phenylobacterium sp.]|uniref:aspartyl/asparaginyl beta-hydroxylase domain-containing protein n=1 Tax=Phenylobacterium sp. TaxID=1871053 RepID=UPI003D2D20AD
MSSTTASPADLQAAWTQGTQALREGRHADAVRHFQPITASGQATAPVWVAVAIAEKGRGDARAALAALDQARALDPRDIRALIMTADHYRDAGDARAASSYYSAVVGVAVEAGAVEKGLEAEVGRAQHMREQYAAQYETQLRGALAGKGLDRPEARRAAKAVDLLTGKAELYLQQPKNFYFPELPNIEWAPREDFPWLDRLEAATDEIRDELKRVLEEDNAFAPYIEAEPDRPFFDDHGMLGNPNWSAFYLWKAGAPVAENAARFPRTMAALADAPLCKIPGRTPSILFSLLTPGAHIPPHHGFMNGRYIVHLPLIVPEGCAMRVGSETRPWVEGKACVFDDSIEHEAWNRNLERLRVVLIFDIWRPELSELEQDLIAATLQAVDDFGAG